MPGAWRGAGGLGATRSCRVLALPAVALSQVVHDAVSGREGVTEHAQGELLSTNSARGHRSCSGLGHARYGLLALAANEPAVRADLVLPTAAQVLHELKQPLAISRSHRRERCEHRIVLPRLSKGGVRLIAEGVPAHQGDVPVVCQHE